MLFSVISTKVFDTKMMSYFHIKTEAQHFDIRLPIDMDMLMFMTIGKIDQICLDYQLLFLVVCKRQRPLVDRKTVDEATGKVIFLFNLLGAK